jgi:hypothetical protein
MVEATRMILLELRNVLPPDFNCEDLVREVNQADIPWTRHYSEYQSGGWWTCSLLGRSVDARDGEVTDVAQPVVTDALEKLPVIRKLLEQMRLQHMVARLARLDPDGALWEHRDYQDLRKVPRQRIHLPLVTNPGAFLVSGGERFYMAPESLWMFRPTTAHGAYNSGDRSRVHLMIDVYEDEHLEQVLADATPAASSAMPKLSAGDLAEKVEYFRKTLACEKPDAEGGAQLDSLTHWERAVLRLYFAFAVEEGALYMALEQAHRSNGNAERARFWRGRRQLMLGEGLQHA